MIFRTSRLVGYVMVLLERILNSIYIYMIYWFIISITRSPVVGLFQGSKIGFCVTMYGKHWLLQTWSSCRYYVFTFDSLPSMEHGASHPVKVPIEIMDVDEEEQPKNTTWGGCQTASRWPFFFCFFVSWVGSFQFVAPLPRTCRCRLSCFIAVRYTEQGCFFENHWEKKEVSSILKPMQLHKQSESLFKSR